MDNQKYCTLVLSGGAMKGLATLGALYHFEEVGLLKDIRTIVATSSGSIIGYLLAIGYKVEEIVADVCREQIPEQLSQAYNHNNTFNLSALCSFSVVRRHLERLTRDKLGTDDITLAGLRAAHGITLVCMSYNLSRERADSLDPASTPDLSCLTAIEMSSCVPFIFEPVRHRGDFFVDGGIVANFPYRHAVAHYGDAGIVGVVCVVEENKEPDDSSFFDKIARILRAPIRELDKVQLEQKRDGDIVFPLQVPAIPIYHFNISPQKVIHYVSIGQQQAQEFIGTINGPSL